MANGAESSFTVAGPPASRARIARRVGSASAAKVVLSVSAGMAYLTSKLLNLVVILMSDRSGVKLGRRLPRRLARPSRHPAEARRPRRG